MFVLRGPYARSSISAGFDQFRSDTNAVLVADPCTPVFQTKNKPVTVRDFINKKGI